LKFKVKLAPSAKKNAVQGWEGELLKCSVTAAPEKGKANKALIVLLSKYYRIPKTAFSIVQGETERLKTILVDSSYENLIH
jgi:hypothetical protein